MSNPPASHEPFSARVEKYHAAACYRDGTPNDKEFVHLFAEAFYIAARLDHFRDLPDLTQLADDKSQNRYLARNQAAAKDFGTNPVTLRNWWQAASYYMENKSGAFDHIPERGEDWYIPKEPGLIAEQTFGHLLTFTSAVNMVASWYERRRKKGRDNERTTTEDDMINFIRDQFKRSSPPVPLTPDQETVIREFAEQHPTLFKNKKRDHISPTAADADVMPGNLNEVLKDNAPDDIKESIGTNRALRYLRSPVGPPGPFR